MALILVLAAIFFAIPVNTNDNVLVAPPFEPACFECEARGDFLVWLINTVALTDATKEEREIEVDDLSSNGTQHSVLTITALPDNDGIEIGCLVGNAPYHVTFFDERKLEVRGVSSVENLTLNFTSSNSLFISWSPPIYHSDDVISADLIYNVSVTNEEESLILSNTLIEVSDVTECDTFNVSVTALFILNSKNYRSATRTERNEGSYSIALDKKCSTKQAVFQLEFSPLHCPSFVSIDIEPSNGNRSVFMTLTNWNMEYFNYTLLPFEHYKVVLHVKNLREQVKNELVANISTYRVQSTDLEQYNNGSVIVSCQYCVPVAESTGEGCYVIFNNSAGGLEKTINITGSNEEIITFKESDIYTVTTYDLVNGFIKGPAIAPEQIEVTIDNIDPSTSIFPSTSIDPSTSTGPSTPTNPKKELSTAALVGICFGIVPVIVLAIAAYMLIVFAPCPCPRKRYRHYMPDHNIQNYTTYYK